MSVTVKEAGEQKDVLALSGSAAVWLGKLGFCPGNGRNRADLGSNVESVLDGPNGVIEATRSVRGRPVMVKASCLVYF